MTTLTEIYGARHGLNIDNLEETTDEEIDTFLNNARRARGPLDPGPQYDIENCTRGLQLRGGHQSPTARRHHARPCTKCGGRW